MMDYALLLAGYSLEDTVASLTICDAIATFLPVQHRILIFNGPDLDALIPRLSPAWSFFSGSNSNHEFSAWQEGLNHLHQEHSSPDLFIFANDTIGRPCSELRNLDMLSFLCTLNSQPRHALVGYWGRFEPHQHIRLFNLSTTGRICTALFAMSGSVLQALGGQIDSQDQLRRCLFPEHQPDSLISNHCSPDLRDHLHTWLLEGGWHSSGLRPMNPSEFRRLSAKALCILNEILLSARCRRLGVTLLPVPAFAQGGSFRQLCRWSRRGSQFKQQLLRFISPRVLSRLKAFKRNLLHPLRSLASRVGAP